jgi:hypothetical protein
VSTEARAAGAQRHRQSQPTTERPATTLKVVPAPATRASSGTFALVVAGMLAVGLLGLLALNTLLTQGAFTTASLTSRQSTLTDQEQALEQAVAVLDSPSQLAVAARRLGMVATVNPVFIDPATGKILGVPLAGRAPAAPRPTATPSAAASATAKPSAGSPSASPTSGATATPSSGPSPHPSAHPSPSATR